MTAPDFSLPDQNDVTHSLEEYRGKWLVLYFYPKDDTPGCTTEACGFRDSFAQLQEAGITVVGISKDSVESHRKFADKYSLPFTLLADPDKATIQAYGAWGMKKFMGKEFEGTLRKTFIISPEGEIAKEYPNVTPQGHAEELLSDLAALQKD